MVDTFLNSSLRDETGSNASHRVRAEGHVPGVVYGHDFPNYHLELDKREINRIIKDYGENAIVNLSISGNSYPAMIKDVQRDVVTGEIIHLDLQHINASEKIHTYIPVVISGKESIDHNGILQKQLEKLEVECLPHNVPKYISIDVSELSLGSSLKISDVEFGEELSVLNDLDQVIVSVSAVKNEEVDEEEESNDLIQEMSEPELVGDEKTDKSEEE